MNQAERIKSLKRAVIILSILLIFTLGVVIGMAMAAPVTANVSVNVTLNDTDGTASYPGGNFSLVLNGSTLLDLLVNVPAQNISVNLSPGGQVNLTGAYDVLGLYCQEPAACTNTTVVQNGTCSVTRTLQANEQFSQVGSACDLHFTCSAGTIVLANGTACPSSSSSANSPACYWEGNYTNVTIKKNVTVDKVGNLFSVTLDGKTSLISGDFTNASQSIPLEFVCPMEIKNITDDMTGQELFEVCTSYGPLFASWLNLTLNRCFDNFDAYRDFVNTRDAVVAQASQDLSDCRASNGEKDGTITVLNSQVANLNDIIQKDQQRDQIYVIVMSLMGFIIIALIVGTVVLAHRAGAEG